MTKLEIMTAERDALKARAEAAEALAETLTAQLRARRRQVKNMLAFPASRSGPAPIDGFG